MIYLRNRCDTLELADNYDYLQGLPVARILIGVGNAKLLVTLKKRERKKFEEAATKTKLGWTMYGNVEEFGEPSHRLLHICTQSTDEELHEKISISP